MHRKTIWKWRFTLWSTFTVCELENGPVEIVTIYPSKNDIVHSYVSMLTRYLWWSKKKWDICFFFPSQNHRISPEIFHVVIIIVVIIPIIIVVIWWLYDGIITYYIYISGCWCNFTILKKKWWSSSMGRMTSHIFPYMNMEHKIHVWNHPPVIMGISS